MHPNPAGYYLNLSPETESEIKSLPLGGLYSLAADLATGLVQPEFIYVVSTPSNKEIENLNPSDKIALFRWIGELMACAVNAIGRP